MSKRVSNNSRYSYFNQVGSCNNLYLEMVRCLFSIQNTIVIAPNNDPNMEDLVASLDFGVAPKLDLASILEVTSTTPAQGFYDDNDPIAFTSTTMNQGDVPVSDLTITNYLPSELENPALVASSLIINGMIPPCTYILLDKQGNSKRFVKTRE